MNFTTNATTLPASQGYGSRLVTAKLEGLGGKLGYDWTPNRLNVEMRFPLGALQE